MVGYCMTPQASGTQNKTTGQRCGQLKQHPANRQNFGRNIGICPHIKCPLSITVKTAEVEKYQKNSLTTVKKK